MKKLSMILIAMLCLAYGTIAQTVGIGTNTPSVNAALDVSSTNKGLMLPRLTDTGAVSNPSAGLVIYNQRTNTPNYHNGVQWQSLVSSRLASAGDSLTYTIFTTTGNLVVGTYRIYDLTQSGLATYSGSGVGGVTVDPIHISKPFDANSVPFKRMLLTGAISPSIEFNIYSPGSATPYLSIMLKSWTIISSATTVDANGKFLEICTMMPPGSGGIIGFKDWLTNFSVSYNLGTRVATTGYPTP